MHTALVSGRVSRQLADKLEELAEQTDRSKSYHMEQALRDYVDVQLWQVRHIQRGLEEIERGKGIPHERVMAEFRAWIRRRGQKSSRKKTRR